MSLRYVKHFDLNILKLADNLILHGNVFQRMSELYANDFFIIFVIGRITTKLLGADHLTWKGGGGYGLFLKKYSDSPCCWKKYSDFGGGKK